MRPHALHPGAIQGKEGIKFCHLATLRKTHLTLSRTGTPDSNSATSLLFFWLAVIELPRCCFIAVDIFQTESRSVVPIRYYNYSNM